MAQNVDYWDYTILPYNFMDISRTDKVPVTFVYDQTNSSQMNGLSFKGYQYKDWRTMLEEIVKYERENAVVPENITLAGPNDLLSLLNNK